jgi:hypothetical protein
MAEILEANQCASAMGKALYLIVDNYANHKHPKV